MTQPILKNIVIHCKPAILNSQAVKDGYLNWKYSDQYNEEEVDIFLVDDSDLDDEELCELNDINYDLVNCIELLGRM